MFEANYAYSYLFLNIPFLVIWVLIFLLSKETRKEQITMSLITLPLGPLSEVIYFKDYWLPSSILLYFIGPVPVFIEDFLFAFSIGGIGAVVSETIFKRGHQKLKPQKHRPLILVIAVSVIIMLLMFKFGINSIYASSVSFVLISMWILVHRKDLVVDSLVSGVSVMLVMFLSYLILFNLVSNIDELYQKIWLLYKTNLDYRLLNIPVTELVWGFTWGMLAGPLYEYWKNVRLN